jgi:hypothetical protein
MNANTYTLIILVGCIGLLLTSFPNGIGPSSGAVQKSAILDSSGTIQKAPQAYTYIISVSGSNYQMKNGATGQIISQGTDSSQVFGNVIGNCSSGATIGVEAGTYTVSTQWLIKSKSLITMTFEAGAKLFAANGLTSNVLAICESNDIIINNPEIDGNAANQEAPLDNAFPIDTPVGIFIGGFSGTGSSNVQINNPNVYNVREFGVYIGFTTNNNCGVTGGTIHDCGWNGWTSGIGSTNSYLTNCEIYYCSDVGASTYSIGSIITGNYIHDMNGNTGSGYPGSRWAIGIEGGSGDTITGNTIKTSAMGFFNAGFANVILSQNTFIDIDETGVYVQSGSTGTIITGNDFALCIGGVGAEKLFNAGTGTIISGNTGYP